MKRRNLLAIIGASAATLTVATIPGLRGIATKKRTSNVAKGCIKISPIAGVNYSSAALVYMEQARFDTPRQAIYGMKDPNIKFIIQYLHA